MAVLAMVPVAVDTKKQPSSVAGCFNLASQSRCSAKYSGGKEGIRTLDTLFTYTRFPGVRLKPLIHLSVDYYPDFLIQNNVKT